MHFLTKFWTNSRKLLKYLYTWLYESVNCDKMSMNEVGKAWTNNVRCMFTGNQRDDAAAGKMVNCSYDKV
jgi:hypothetical protein